MSRTEQIRIGLRWLLTVAMVGVGVAHFVDPQPFVRLIEGMIPSPLAMVYFTGVCEISGGLGLIHPRTRKAAAIALMVFFIAVFPANVRMAVERIPMDGVAPVPDWAAYARLPFQLMFIAWAWFVRR